jgi:protein involved in polysaccharide export with SLBB domain
LPALASFGGSPEWRRGLVRLALSWLLLVALAFGAACGNNTALPNLPKPVPATTLGVGDAFELRIVGEDKLPVEYTIAADGTVDLPYVDRVKVEGLEPQEIARRVRDLLVEKEVLLRPNVSVVVKKYNSKRIEVQGEVKKPDSFPLEPGMTLVGAISRAGGLTAMANKQSITIRRTTKSGKVVAASVSYAAIIDNEIPDVPLQAGDSVYVDERAF